MAYKRAHLTPRAKRRLPAYSANWKVIGPVDTATSEIAHAKSDVTVFCSLHEVLEVSKPRYLLNSSNSALKFPCRACAIENPEDSNKPGGTTWRLLKNHFSTSADWDFLAAVAPDCGNQLGRAQYKEHCTARCTKTIPGTRERCGRTATQTVGNWLYHFRHPEKNHLKCQGECCSSQKGRGKRLSPQTQINRLTTARAGAWLPCPSRNRKRWAGLGARKWYIHTPCGFAVYRSDQHPFLEVRCQTHHHDFLANRRQMRTGTSFGCPMCTSTLVTLPRAWNEEEAEDLLRRRGFTPLATPADYADRIPMRDPSGETIHASTFTIVTRHPASTMPTPPKPTDRPFRSGLPFSPTDDAVLCEMAQTGRHHWADIAAHLNRTPGSIKQRARRLGVTNTRIDHRHFMTCPTALTLLNRRKRNKWGKSTIIYHA